MMLRSLCSLSLFAPLAFASAGFTSLELKSVKPNGFATDPWAVTLGYEVDTVTVGETFALDLPYVYRVGFTDQETSLTAQIDDVDVIECTSTSGGYSSVNSTLTCTVLEGAEPYSGVSGELYFYVYFAVGGSSSEVELAAAKAWAPARNTITWGYLSTNVTFATGPVDNEDFYYYAHTTGEGYAEVYFLFPTCFGYEMEGDVDISFGSSVTCDDSDFSHSAYGFNAWYFPDDAFSTSAIGSSCSTEEIAITYAGIPKNYRAYATAVQALSDDTIVDEVWYQLTCGDSSTSDDLTITMTVASRTASAFATGLISNSTA